MWGTAVIMGDRSSPLGSSREDPHGQTQLLRMVLCRILRQGNGLGTGLSLKARILVQRHPNPSSSGWHHPWTRTISASALTTSGWMRGGLALQVVCSEVAWLVDRQISAARKLNRGEPTPSFVTDRVGDRDAPGAQVRQRLLDVVAHY